MAILGAEGPGATADTLPDFLERHDLELLWHPSLSPETPSELAGMIDRIVAGEQDLTLLCVEGSIINGPDGTGLFDTFEGVPKRDVGGIALSRGGVCDRDGELRGVRWHSRSTA